MEAHAALHAVGGPASRGFVYVNPALLPPCETEAARVEAVRVKQAATACLPRLGRTEPAYVPPPAYVPLCLGQTRTGGSSLFCVSRGVGVGFQRRRKAAELLHDA